MTEQEKLENVIKGLEYCLDIQTEWEDARYVCPSCPYAGNGIPCETLAPLMEDALALLKAQKETIPIDFLMRYAQLPTEFAISAWKKPIEDALKKKAKDTDKPMSFDDALQLVNGILSINRGEER